VRLRFPPPSSNRTGGFPASGFHVNSRHKVVHEEYDSLNLAAQPASQEKTVPDLAVSSSVGGLAPKRHSLPLTQTCLRSDPFAPRSLPASLLLWACPTPKRSRCQGYVFPQCVAGISAATPPGLPGSSADLSPRAVPSHPGKPSDCSCPLLHRWQQASSLLGGLATCKLASRGRIRFAGATARRFAFRGFATRITPSHARSAIS
jgi:hypothetical protein